MCGIAGCIAAEGSGQAGALTLTRAMTAALLRRGPDGEGIHPWPTGAFGHRRLAILDLSAAGSQPMISADGLTGLVFNGCIYNFKEIRADLESLGLTFQSHCDTEVLLVGYRAWGIRKLVARLRGMFAFAIWDDALRQLFLVRDRLGVKPLVYAAEGGRIAFASTVDALRAAGLARAINPDAVLEFLEFGFVRDQSAIFHGIRKLPPATILEWRDGSAQEHIYWTLPAPAGEPVRFEAAVDEAESLLIEAVRVRLVSDVPLGALLSGGIDSTLICWALAQARANVTAFTVSAPGEVDDEAGAAQRTARLLKLDHRIVPLPVLSTESGPGLVTEVVAAYSEPFAVQSALGMLLASQATRPSAKVLLTGDGGDDVFLGYPFLRNARTAERLAGRLPAMSPGFWKRMRAMIPSQRARHLLDYSTSGLAGHARAHDGLPWYEARGILGPALAGHRLEVRALPESFESARRLLSDVLDYHRKTHFTSEFLPKVDGATMYFGIEARAPFLDQKLWEFASSLPFSVRLRGGELKAVLREIVRRRIGKEAAHRPKQGFSVPVERWLAGRWSGALDCLEAPALLENQGWIAPGRLRPAVEDARRRGAIPVQLWRLLILERWLASRAPGA